MEERGARREPQGARKREQRAKREARVDFWEFAIVMDV
jgi:hypothetical protein